MGSVVIRFPDGTKEFRYPPRDLAEGDIVWHDGDPYRVLAVASSNGTQSVTVEPASDGIGDVVRSERGGIVLVPAD